MESCIFAQQNVVFVPTKDHNHLADSFGLYSVKAQKIDPAKLLKVPQKLLILTKMKSNLSDSQVTNNPLRHFAAAAAAGWLFSFYGL